jgi:hypothetical protein
MQWTWMQMAIGGVLWLITWSNTWQSDSNCWLRLWMECGNALMHGSALWGKVL